MLKTRALTAVFILAAFLPGLFLLSQTHWALLVALIAGLAAWEWGGLIRLGRGGRILYGGLLATSCAIASLMAPGLVGIEFLAQPAVPIALAVHGLAAVFWMLLVPAWLRWKWPLAGPILGGGVGLLVIVPTWLALVQLRLVAPVALLAILAVVWIADIAAYFAGRAFGRHKLAPTISPGKTWEGAVGAGVGVLAYGLAVRDIFHIDGISLSLWLPGLLLIAAVSILGDLFESLIKRQAGLKDSSHILPGHGGILDRIDSLTSTLPTVALLWLIFEINSP